MEHEHPCLVFQWAEPSGCRQGCLPPCAGQVAAWSSALAPQLLPEGSTTHMGLFDRVALDVAWAALSICPSLSREKHRTVRAPNGTAWPKEPPELLPLQTLQPPGHRQLFPAPYWHFLQQLPSAVHPQWEGMRHQKHLISPQKSKREPGSG